jgi:hypothetical protein
MTLFMVLLLSLATVADAKKPGKGAAQDVCAKSEASVDPFNGEAVRTYKALRWSLATSGGKSALVFNVGKPGAIDTALSPGWILSVALDSGDSLQLKTTTEVPSVIQATSSLIVTSWSPRFELTSDQVRQFATQELVAMRYELNGNTETFEANDGLKKNFIEAFACAATLVP